MNQLAVVYEFSALDLSAMDRTIKVAYEGGGIHRFTEENDSWKRSPIYLKHIDSSNRIANSAIKSVQRDR